ncbi:hypothetical protein Lepto7375DRAFT_2758 [Leptolyngbya sp. PCC 7375]|nr:hypothetical protein Lepto7375DRAFT_2758 [Leptolyngbya sp. PCC 7375]
MNTKSDYRVQGTIIVEGQHAEMSIARLYIRLIDTSRADASAITIECQETANLWLVPGTRIPFDLQLTADLDPRTRVEVAVHADKEGTGGVSKGDFINMVSIPVPPTQSSTGVVVPIRQVP